MEKQNKKYRQIIFHAVIFLLMNIYTTFSYSQIYKIDYSNPQTYEIGGITISGGENLNNNTLINITGLEIGMQIKIPGDNISNAITNLWKQGLFSNVDIGVEKIVDNIIFLKIDVSEISRLSIFKFKGKISKSDISSLKEELKLNIYKSLQ